VGEQSPALNLKKNMKIKFVKSPVGFFGLAHFENDVVELESKLAAEIIEAGFGVEVIEESSEEISEEEVKPKKKK
jgi:hypothetical protein